MQVGMVKQILVTRDDRLGSAAARQRNEIVVLRSGRR
jgi:hypothetical protein